MTLDRIEISTERRRLPGMTLFLSILNWWAFATDSPWVVKAITAMFDLILIMIWIERLRRVGAALKFGGSRVEFTRFPCQVGGAVILQWRPAAGIGHARKGAFTVRTVEERFEHRGSLRAPQPVFWEFEVALDLPGLDFEEIYVVPEYGH